MKINEIILEGHKGKLPKSQSRAMHRTHAYGDGYKTNGTYNFYRVGMAAAMADGSRDRLPIDDRTWYHSKNVAVPYTELEHDMMHQAFNVINSDVDHVVNDHRSLESDAVNKRSPTAAPKRNKYGV